MYTLMGSFLNADNWLIYLKQWDAKRSTLEVKDKLQARAKYPIVQGIKVDGNATAGIPEAFRLTIQIPNFVGVVL